MQPDTLSAALSQSGFENLTFSTPWSARLFGMTLAASEKKLFTLKQFQSALIERIGEHEKNSCITTEEDYYTCWLGALQNLLEAKELWHSEQLKSRETEVVEAGHHRKEQQRRDHHHVQPEAIR